MAIKDATFEIDDFQRNKIVSGVNAEAQQLYLLLTMVPGDCEDDPEKGIDMKQYAHGIAEKSAMELKSAIEKQVDTYCDFKISDIEVMLKDNKLVVGIKTPSSNDIMLFTATENTNDVLARIITT